MTSPAEPLNIRLARVLAADDDSIDSSADAIVRQVIDLVDALADSEAEAAVGGTPADVGSMVEASLRRAFREIRHDRTFYGNLCAGWSDERIDRFATALCVPLGRDWFGVC